LDITQESFEALLEWLEPDDREVAGQKYELIYAGLVRFFVSHGVSDAEHLADKTVDVVIRRLPDIRDTYVGEKAKYFLGVARNINMKRTKEVAMDEVPEQVVIPTNISEECECLIRCLKFLPSDKREFILDYHRYEGHDKIEHHRCMAVELGITVNALRGRAHQLRVKLEKCVSNALRATKQKAS